MLPGWMLISDCFAFKDCDRCYRFCEYCGNFYTQKANRKVLELVIEKPVL